MADSQQNTDGLNSNNLNPPIIMKIDAPTEETNSKDSESDGQTSCAKLRLMVDPALNDPPPPEKQSRGILKPPQLSLSSKTPNKSNFVLAPSKLNPFANSSKDVNIETCDKQNSTQVNGDAPKFVPLLQTEIRTNIVTPSKPSTTENAPVAPNTSFVFGQNLQERVMSPENKVDEATPSTSLNSNGSTEMLFSSAIKNEVKTDNNSTKESKSLSESAREYEESRANKRKYDEVEVKTGEEEETNVINMSCKLFAYDKASGSWQERGRGTLRLNDLETDENQTQSRLVFRTSGSLRVILNTKIWAEMTVERASDKSIRLTALDSNGEIKVFLIMANIEDSKQLFIQLQSRVQKEVLAVQKKRKPDSESDSGGQ